MKFERQRYILFYYIIEKDITIDGKSIINLIWNNLFRYFGVKETSKIGLWLVKFNLEERWGILRFSHTSKEIVITSLGMIRYFQNYRISIYPIKTSGTIKKLTKILKTFQLEKNVSLKYE